MTDGPYRDLEKLLKDVMEEQKQDKTYLRRFLKSPSIRDHIAGFKQKLDDTLSNLTVRTLFYLISLYSLISKSELTLLLFSFVTQSLSSKEWPPVALHRLMILIQTLQSMSAM
jgi:hypothetical protein